MHFPGGIFHHLGTSSENNSEYSVAFLACNFFSFLFVFPFQWQQKTSSQQGYRFTACKWARHRHLEELRWCSLFWILREYNPRLFLNKYVHFSIYFLQRQRETESVVKTIFFFTVKFLPYFFFSSSVCSFLTCFLFTGTMVYFGGN